MNSRRLFFFPPILELCRAVQLPAQVDRPCEQRQHRRWWGLRVSPSSGTPKAEGQRHLLPPPAPSSA